MPDFPHLPLSYRGQFKPKFKSRHSEIDATVLANRENPQAHSIRIRNLLERIRNDEAEIRRQRVTQGLPSIPAGKGFILKVPNDTDADVIAHALGVELVAETNDGLMLVSSVDLSFEKLKQVLSKFELGTRGGGSAASILDVFDNPQDSRRITEILSVEALSMWPFEDLRLYDFDVGIQTADSTRNIINWPRIQKKRGETQAEYSIRRESARRNAMDSAINDWDERAEERFQELLRIVEHPGYNGLILSGLMNDPIEEVRSGMLLPDSFQVRVRMNGLGFKDLITNITHLFEIAIPQELEESFLANQSLCNSERFTLTPPSTEAPAVCVIDSGIQEDHLKLAAAIDRVNSRNFIPDLPNDHTADEYSPRGHGTRVASALLFPQGIPQSGTVASPLWIQNARVLDKDLKLPQNLPPEQYLQRVVDFYKGGSKKTKIFNHSINSCTPCPKKRMTAWATKIDDLSHSSDILFIQSAGNISLGVGNSANPGLRSHLSNGVEHPNQLLESESSRIANPGQSMHALTVGAVAVGVLDNADECSFAKQTGYPAAYSRSGYAPPWSIVKPEVVEYAGDVVHSKSSPYSIRIDPQTSIELLNSTLYNEPASSCDAVGTSFAAPIVAGIAAQIQKIYPDISPLLYRALIVNSARWPEWTETQTDTDEILRLIGYGIPSVERATSNSESRVTLIMQDSEEISSDQFHLYTISIPEELRNPASEAQLRVDITLAYTATPRRTRANNRGYMARLGIQSRRRIFWRV